MRTTILVLVLAGCFDGPPELAPERRVASLPLAIAAPRIERCEVTAICDPDGRGRCD